MKKTYIAGGLIFWAGLSGYMGLRILESYTEDAVFAALSAVPAQAQEIRYSFLSNTLRLKGVEYEVPDDKIMHKGTIENVEVKGFNRKCMFVKPDMPAYDADALPIVAESITITGLNDKQHIAKTKIEQTIGTVHIQGWYQRLGILLDQRQQHKGEASYYEEAYRYRLDGMEINNLSLTYTEPELSPVAIDIDSIALTEGVRAPRGSEKVSPFSLTWSGIRFSEKDNPSSKVSGGIQRLDIKDVLLPEPDTMAALVRMTSKLLDAENLEADADSGDYLLDTQIENIVMLLEKYYASRLPISHFGMQGFNLCFDEDKHAASGEPSLAVNMHNFGYTMGLTGAGAYKNTMVLDDLKVTSSALSRDAVIARYAPEGFTLNASGETLTDDTKIEGKARYELEGLGELETSLVLSGDIKNLQLLSVSDIDDLDPYDLMQRVYLNNLNIKYKDSGLLALAIESLAKSNFQSPDVVLSQIMQNLQMIASVPDNMPQQCGKALMEQFTQPGTFQMAFSADAPMSFMALFSMVMAEPGSLPLTFSSTPGQKALKDYFPKQ